MGKKFILVAVLLVTALLTLAACGSSGGGAGDRAAQLTAGRAVYADQCATCHGNSFEGGSGPALNAANLAKYGDGKGLLDYTSANMPLSNPGALSQEQYLQSTALILDHIQALPADQALTTGNAANFKIAP